jgi:ectoine hydroxylase-related dioxygenase (phytanoyl-CoA dioxygenase family)
MYNESFVSEYLTNGYVVIKDLFTQSEIETVLFDLNCVLNARLKGLANSRFNLTSQLKHLYQSDSQSYNSFISAIENLASINRLTSSSSVINYLKKIGIEIPSVSGRPVCNFLIPEEGNGSLRRALAHQDWAFTRGSLDSVTLWFPLFDISESVYPLEVLPGSHLLGLLPFNPKNLELSADVLKDSDFVKLCPKRGDAILFSSFLVHRTGLSLSSEGCRFAMSSRYNNMKEESYIERDFYESFYFKEKADHAPFNDVMREKLNELFTERRIKITEKGL